MGTTSEAPAASLVPAAGTVVALNGPPGGATPVMTSGWVPVLTTLTPSCLAPPVLTDPKSRAVGSAPRPGWVPVPCRSSAVVPTLVVKVRVPDGLPQRVGEKLTGTESTCPAAR